MTTRWHWVLIAVLIAGVPVAHSEDVPENETPKNRPGIEFLPVGRDASGIEVHLAPAGDLSNELVFPCGKEFAPPVGLYRVWLEGLNLISPTTYSLVYSPAKGTDSAQEEEDHPAKLPLSPAGGVRLKSRPESTSLIFRALSLESHMTEIAQNWQEFSRSSDVVSAQQHGFQMPVGRVVTAIYDRDSQQYVGLSQPTEILHGSVVEVEPTLPDPPESHLIARIERQRAVAQEEDDVAVFLEIAEGERVPPDVLVPTAYRIYAIWYQLTQPRGTLHVESATWFSKATDVPLASGRIESIELRLQRKPQLDVRYILPEELDIEQAALELRDSGNGHMLRVMPVHDHNGLTSFHLLDPAEYRVEVTAPPWTFSEVADLRDGVSGEVVIEAQPIVVRGRVEKDGDPVDVEMRWTHLAHRRATTVMTAPTGEYRVVLFQPGVYTVQIWEAQERGFPYIEFVDPPIRDDDIIDFVLPAGRAAFRIIDKDTGDPIAGAKALVTSKGEDGHNQSLPVESGADGEIRLKNLRCCSLQLRVSADGYRDETIDAQVLGADSAAPVPIPLSRESDSEKLVVLLPDGQPAEGAEVAVFADLTAAPIWAANTLSNGSVLIPERLTGMVLSIRHRRGALHLERWQPSDADRAPPRRKLEEPATPLTVKTVGVNEEAAPFSRILVEVNGWRLSGAGLAVLCGGGLPLSGPNGIWTGRFLPAGLVRVIAWKVDEAIGREILSGSYDYRMVALSYPWSNVTVEVLE